MFDLEVPLTDESIQLLLRTNRALLEKVDTLEDALQTAEERVGELTEKIEEAERREQATRNLSRSVRAYLEWVTHPPQGSANAVYDMVLSHLLADVEEHLRLTGD